MPYIIDATVDNHGETQAIDSLFYGEIKDATRVISHHHTIEERFDIFLKNYVEYEVKIFQLLMEHTMQAKKFHDPADQTPTEIERYLANFLSSARGYREQIVRTRHRGTNQEVKRILLELESKSNEYSVVEALRNYSQHENLLIRGWSLQSGWADDDDGKKRRKHGFDPRIPIEAISASLKKMPSVQTKLLSLTSEDGDISVIPLLRKYVEDISHVHSAIRDLNAEELKSARAVVAYARQMGVELGAEPDANMFAYHLDADESIIDKVFLGSRRSASLDHLQRKNSAPLVRFGVVQFYT